MNATVMRIAPAPSPLSARMRAASLLALLSVAGLFQACSAASPASEATSASAFAPTCAASPTSCRCSNVPFELDNDESPVASCDILPSTGVPWKCEYDLNSEGESTTCGCGAWGCAAQYEGSVCKCAFGGFVGDTDATSADCSPSSGDDASDAVTCWAPADPQGLWDLCDCVVGGPDNLTGGYVPVQVSSCSLTAPPSHAGQMADGDGTDRYAPTCAGLKWVAPAPVPDAGASGNATSSDTNPCPDGCSGCSYCAESGCVICPVGEEGVCTC